MKITEIINEDWNKVNHHDKTDGLSQKAVNAYRRENPGSKLKTAVTTKPSKLKPGSKAAKRRKSFCARMGGNKGPMKKPNGKPTPKALALRRWNCESIEEMQELIMLGETYIATLKEGWSQKYKSSINCSHPKGFSQKAHCAGKKKHNEDITMEMTCPDCGMCQTHGKLSEIAKGAKDSNGFTKCWPGKHAEGTKKGKNGGQVRNCVPNESQGVAEGSNDTIYPNAEVIKSKNGKPVGEIYQDGNSWGAFHYRADRGYDFIDSREEAIEALKDLHQETGRSRPDYTIKGVAEAANAAQQAAIAINMKKNHKKPKK